jgi:hypothetical protein
LHQTHPFQRSNARWLAAVVGALMLLLAVPAIGRAEESNPNDYTCTGRVSAGEPEPGSEEQQVKYTFTCNGPISGYQVAGQVPFTGVSSPPLITDLTGKALPDTFSCSGEVPGYAANCVGGTKLAFERVTGQFSIEKKLCVEPRVDPLLTVTYAYLEKNVITQAISGPFDLGRPHGCPPDKFSGGNRLEPKEKTNVSHKKKKHKKKSHKASRKHAALHH